MAVIKAIHSKANIATAIQYIERPCKTEAALMTGIACSSGSAAEEMLITKKIWGKTAGRSYDHYVQSFAPEEKISPKEAHAIAVEWAQKEFSGFEVMIATHTDTQHLHSHILVNSVSYVDGHKLHTSSHWLEEAKRMSDDICLSHGLTITQKGYDFEGFRRQKNTIWSKDDYYVMQRAKCGEIRSYVYDIFTKVSYARAHSHSREEYIDNLATHGISVRWSDTRRDITYVDADGHRIRSSRLEKITGTHQDKAALSESFSHNLVHSHRRSTKH